MQKFEERLIVVRTLPIQGGTSFSCPEETILEFVPGKTLDFGALCYLSRSENSRKKNKGRMVLISSFNAVRALEIRELIDKVNENFISSGLRPLALHSQYARLIYFINWCDANGHIEVLRDVDHARCALRAHVADARRRVDQHQMNNNTAAGCHLLILRALEIYFSSDELDVGINFLTAHRYLKMGTEVPGDEDQSKVVAWCICLIDGLCPLLLDKTSEGKPVPFPFLLTVPGYLNYPGNAVWIFPLRQWNRFSKTEHKNSAYDYDNGVIFSNVELSAKRPEWSVKRINESIRKAYLNIDRAKLDQYHSQRILRGLLVQYAFFVLFIAVTGANDTQALELPWSEELESTVKDPSIERQGFRRIKYRAKGRVVSFEIGVKYMPYLRRFLQLREYLLMGKRCEFLFFRYPGNNFANNFANGEPTSAYSLSLKFYTALKKISQNLPELKCRKWRAAKQHHLIRREDPVITAQVMQHSIPTSVRNYSNGSEVTHQIEMGEYFHRMEKIVVPRGEILLGSEVRSLGSCAEPNCPTPLADRPPLVPDCQRAEGCLFCDKYRVHADEIDCRKVLSARHCVRITAQYARSVEEYDQVFGVVLNRLEEVLAEIKKREPRMVENLEKQVDIDGELDKFWSAKLETLVSLGMELL